MWAYTMKEEISMSWEKEIKKGETPIEDKMKKDVKKILRELLTEGERKEKITVSRSLLNMIWNLI